jgi:hypothetical protein
VRKNSKVLQWIAPCSEYIPFYVHPESQDHIYDDGRTHCKKRNINKPHPDAGSSYTHFFTDSRTNAKSLPFDKILELIHIANLEIFYGDRKHSFPQPGFNRFLSTFDSPFQLRIAACRFTGFPHICKLEIKR